MNGTDRIRVMAKGLGMSCWRVASTPRLVTVSMINDHLVGVKARVLCVRALRALWVYVPVCQMYA